MTTDTTGRFVPVILIAASLMLTGCHSDGNDDSDPTTSSLKEKVKTVVFIYAENRSFDNLYGAYPGANGIPGINPASLGSISPQKDRDASASVLAKLPQTWGGVTAAGQAPVVTQAQSDNLPNSPFPIETSFGTQLTLSTVTRDLYHRFFENQMQIGGGNNDQFAAFADSGGLVMGYYDGSQMAMWNVARQYVLADNFFQATFGGSFLNHQYLICACAPEYPNADTAAQKPTIAVVDKDASGKFLPKLTSAPASPVSALDGPPTFVSSGNIAPKDYFGDATFRAVNTMQPPFQPSGNAPTDATGDDLLLADSSKATTLPAQSTPTIGDQLTKKSVSWAWYAGAWDAAVADGRQDPSKKRTVIYSPSIGAPDFQAHHQPFNYYAAFDPVAHSADRAAHLKDYNDLIVDAAAGTLPQVVFYKPEGDLNQHSGYASIQAGDAHIAALIAKLQSSPQWNNMVIVVTYDENGGFWDHVPPPKADLLGPGTRIPAIIVSPFAKKGTVDHTQYDTASIIRLLDRRFGLDPLPGLKARDDALKAHGDQAMGDLTNALQL